MMNRKEFPMGPYRNGNKYTKKGQKRPFSLKIKTVNLIKKNSTFRHTLSGSIEFKNLDWKIGVHGVKSSGSINNKINDIDLSKLEILKSIGSGGQSEVKLCKYEGRHYALKIIHLDEMKHGYVNSRYEINLLRNIRHERIVLMEQAFIKDKRICLLLEFMDCGTLKRVHNIKLKITENVLSLITYQILKGMVFLHSEKLVIHRDIKPTNFLVHSKGVVKITDFGVAKKIDAQDMPSLTGTKKYASPQCLNFERCSFKCDIWALGLSIAEIALSSENGYFNYVTKNIQKNGVFFDKKYFSKNLFKFISACLVKDDRVRPTASQLLNFDFITKYNNIYNYDRQKILEKYFVGTQLKFVDTDDVEIEDVEMKDTPNNHFII